MSKKPTAHIENWFKSGNVLFGTISKHIRQDDFHSKLQRTSMIVSFDPKNNRCETLNTVYTLGKPYNADKA